MTTATNDTVELSRFSGRWKLDSAHSTVTFRSTAMWGFVKVEGRFTSVKGESQVDLDGVVSGRLVIDAVSVDTNKEKRDTHLRSDDFFATSKHSQIVYEVNRVDAIGPNQVHLVGTLTVIGNSRPLELDADITNADNTGVTVEAAGTVDRSQWGIAIKKNGMTKMDTGIEISARFVRAGSSERR